jgi:hypothetical protein
MFSKGNKKNKKSFSDGLDSLFHHTLFEDNLQDNPSVFDNDEEVKREKVKKTRIKKSKPKNKVPKKSFAMDLDHFLKESIEDSLGGSGTVTDIKRNINRDDNRKAIGIDILLRQTVDRHMEILQPKKESRTKRVTVVLDEDQVLDLKRVAKKEKRHLKSIFAELVSQYLQPS